MKSRVNFTPVEIILMVYGPGEALFRIGFNQSCPAALIIECVSGCIGGVIESVVSNSEGV